MYTWLFTKRCNTVQCVIMKFASRILHPAVYICWFFVLILSACKQSEATTQHTKPQELTKFSVTVSKTQPTVVYFDADKPLNEAFSLTIPVTKEFLPYPLQKRPAVFIPFDKSSILLLVNKTGFIQLSLTASTDETAIVQFDTSINVDGVPINRYSAGSVWQNNNHQYLLLYKDHIFDTEWAETILFDFFGDTVSRIDIPPYPENKQYLPYWIYPANDSTWLIQFRYTTGDRSYTAYASWDRVHNKLSELARAAFEQHLIPITFEKAPVPIQSIAEHIPEPVLLEYRDSNGTIHYLNNNNLDDAVLGIAETNSSGTYVLLEDGRFWIKRIIRGQVSTSSTTITSSGSSPISTPVSSTETSPVITGQASVPIDDVHFKNAILTSNLFICVWEENGFPDTGRSGLYLLLLP